MGSYSYSGSVQTVTVGQDGIYDIVGYGGRGGNASATSNSGGGGAEVGGDFALTAGEKLKIVVGGQGGDASYGGGGGGTFVFGEAAGASSYTLLVAAGGGGGALSGSGGAGLATTAPGSGAGGSAQSTGFSGGGGAGIGQEQAGQSSPRAGGYGGSAGPSYAGGQSADSLDFGNGGFGGGGSAGSGGGGGGGGGYTGGNGGDSGSAGAGGTSYLAALADNTHTVKIDGQNTSGNGRVLITPNVAACYCTGTLIRCLRDGSAVDVAVERLAIGDVVVTASGRPRPIRWIGHRDYANRFVRNNPALLPIRFAAGSLGDGVPARDLLVSPKHAMVLDEVLIPAEHLVNGRSITKETKARDLAYWHVELDSHDVLVAEGAPSESFVDDNSRGMFHNAETFHALYPDVARVEAVYCAPRVEGGYALQRVRRHLAARAGLPVPAARDFGALLGHIDVCVADGRGGMRLQGWAQSMAHPDVPVCLEVVVDGRTVALTSAELFRADLAEAGIGDGRHAFDVVLALPRVEEAVVTVRRAADGAVLGHAAPVAAVPVAPQEFAA